MYLSAPKSLPVYLTRGRPPRLLYCLVKLLHHALTNHVQTNTTLTILSPRNMDKKNLLLVRLVELVLEHLIYFTAEATVSLVNF